MNKVQVVGVLMLSGVVAYIGYSRVINTAQDGQGMEKPYLGKDGDGTRKTFGESCSGVQQEQYAITGSTNISLKTNCKAILLLEKSSGTNYNWYATSSNPAVLEIVSASSPDSVSFYETVAPGASVQQTVQIKGLQAGLASVRVQLTKTDGSVADGYDWTVNVTVE